MKRKHQQKQGSVKKAEVINPLEEIIDARDVTDSCDTPLTDSDILDAIEKKYGDVHNILQLAGGPGTYLILGPTESGKTVSIGAMAREAQQWSLQGIIQEKPMEPVEVIIISSTSEFTEDFNWCKHKAVHFPMSNDSIGLIIKEREAEMKKGGKKAKISPDEWARKNLMYMILDDFYGKIEASQPNNPVNILCTKARHLGICLFALAQGFKQCGPVIKDNARAIICLRLNAGHHTDILNQKCGYPNKETVKDLVTHNAKLYHPVVYFRTWELAKPENGGIMPRFLKLSPFCPIKGPPPKQPDDVKPGNFDVIADDDYDTPSDDE